MLAGLTIAASTVAVAGTAQAGTPEWARPAVQSLDRAGILEKDRLKPNRPMTRRAFKRLIRRAFGPGLYARTGGHVRAGEVSRALVTALGRRDLARDLASAAGPNGWRPPTPRYFGTEIIARQLGLRHDRPPSEDKFEAGARQPLRQADVAWSVWKATTDPSLHAADALAGFQLAGVHGVRRKVVRYAFSLVGSPYVWAGEWSTQPPNDYPYGAQAHGGFDCSGFVWNVLHTKTPNWKPKGRPYEGWQLAERSSSAMAAATHNRVPYAKLRTGDILFFAPSGRKAAAADVYHAAIYLGRGWMIHSSGSRAGVSIDAVSAGSWWHDDFAWGRRVIKR